MLLIVFELEAFPVSLDGLRIVLGVLYHDFLAFTRVTPRAQQEKCRGNGECPSRYCDNKRAVKLRILWVEKKIDTKIFIETYFQTLFSKTSSQLKKKNSISRKVPLSFFPLPHT